MNPPKPGEIVTDGKNVTIGAPLVKGSAGPASPSQALGQAVRHFKGVVVSLEEMKRLLEEQEQKEKENKEQ